MPIQKVLDSHSVTAMIKFNTCNTADHNKYIQHKHIHYAIKELHKNEKIKKELGKEQSKSQEGFKEFVDCSKTVYKKPRHAVCFNPKSKQHRPPQPHLAQQKSKGDSHT